MRPSIDERMDRWLNDEADRCNVTDDERWWFIDHMRGTRLAANVRLSLVLEDLWEDSHIPRWLERFIKTIARIRTDDRSTR